MYGALTELVQDWLGWGRSADLADWFSDILGVGLGILPARGVYRLMIDRSSSQKAEAAS
jgi:VanZ family protein